MLNKQIISYLNTYDLLDRRQNAFRKNHSTETTLLSLFDDLYKSLDSNLPIQLILLDLSAAFDTIDFDILIERLIKGVGIYRYREDTYQMVFKLYPGSEFFY